MPLRSLRSLLMTRRNMIGNSMANSYSIETITRSKQLLPYLSDLAQLRITVFRAFPYLYDGNLEYEEKYLQSYLKSDRSAFILAKEKEKVIGVSTCLPLADETEEVQTPFLENGYNVNEVFYFGESVLLPEYRGRGIGVRFFEAREAFGLSVGDFRYFAFCAVDRETTHPHRPLNYVPLDHFWEKRGYVKMPHLKTFFSWKELDEDIESQKSMTFWMKEI